MKKGPPRIPLQSDPLRMRRNWQAAKPHHVKEEAARGL
jgi:hypothetical protein